MSYVKNKGGSMKKTGPTVEEWKELYASARMFKEYAPWQWMEDSDLFGIEDPESGEIGYCCVIGALEEMLGLLVYTGSEGISLVEALQSENLLPDDEDIHAMQKCIALTFDDRGMQDKKDLEVIKTLGLKFRGRQAWPLIRSHAPGFLPWYVNGSEARFLNIALRLTMGVAERIKEAPDLLNPPEEGHYLVLYKEKQDDDGWREKWVKPAPYEKRKVEASVDDLRLARIVAGSQRVEDSWEVDFFFAPFVVDEGERPFFPYVALFTVHKVDYVLNFSLALYSDFEGEFQFAFLEFLEKTKILPKTIMVKKDVVYDFFKPAADRLGITVKKVKNLKSVKNVKESILNHMAR